MNVYVFYWIVTYSYNKHSLALQVQFYSFVKSVLFNLKCSWKTFFPFLNLSQVRAVDEMNYDFQALALESRGMGEVRTVFVCISFTLLTLIQFSVIII